MSGAHRLIPWLTLTLLTVVGAAGAALGLMASSAPVSLETAATNTLHAPNYTEQYSETGSQSEKLALVWQAPNRLAGYVTTPAEGFFVVVIGTKEYQSVKVVRSHGPNGLTYITGTTSPASASDPAQGLLPYAQRAKDPTRNGDTYSFDLTQDGQMLHFAVTVSGNYVSRLVVTSAEQSADLRISSVGTSPPVKVPTHIKISSSSPSSSSSSAAG